MKALVILRLALALVLSASFGFAPAFAQARATQAALQRVSQVAGPQLLDLEGPNGTLRAAVFRPSGSGPFPVLVVLHGGGGIIPRFLDWAARFTSAEYVVLVGCWARPLAPAVAVACPTLPPPLDVSLRATEAAGVLIDAARRLPGVRSESLGLIGWSWGATLAALVASSGADVRAVVAIAGAYRQNLSPTDVPPLDRVARLQAPVLLLHGKRDFTINVEESTNYEAAARAAGKSVEIFLYDDADHFMILFDPATGEEVSRRSVAFLNRYLRP